MSEKPRRGIIVLSRIIRQGRQRITQLEADLENCVLAKRQAENAVARFTAEGSNLRKRITQLEAELSALKAELKAACTVTFEETEMGECQGDESAVPFEEYAEAVRYAFDEAALVFGDAHDWHETGGPNTETEWADSDAKTRLDERRKEGDNE